jgi:hypothetical protein
LLQEALSGQPSNLQLVQSLACLLNPSHSAWRIGHGVNLDLLSELLSNLQEMQSLACPNLRIPHRAKSIARSVIKTVTVIPLNLLGPRTAWFVSRDRDCKEE